MIASSIELGVTNSYALCRGLEKAGVDFDDLKYLVLTHHHDDHVGLLNQPVAKNPKIKIVMPEGAKDLLARGKNDWSRGGGYINRRIYFLISIVALFGKWKQTFPPYISRENDILVTGEPELRELRIGLDGRIVKTRGHSSDSVSVALPNGDWLAGDAAANMPPFAGTKYCVIALEDLDQYYQTWTEILEAGAKRIYPAHGRPFPAEELQVNLGRNKKSDMVPFR
jgi:hydroxyacylglutathione hydrolase